MCKSSLFKNMFSLFIQLYIAKVLIESGSEFGSGENFPDSAPDPFPTGSGSATLANQSPRGIAGLN